MFNRMTTTLLPIIIILSLLSSTNGINVKTLNLIQSKISRNDFSQYLEPKTCCPPLTSCDESKCTQSTYQPSWLSTQKYKVTHHKSFAEKISDLATYIVSRSIIAVQFSLSDLSVSVDFLTEGIGMTACVPAIPANYGKDLGAVFSKGKPAATISVCLDAFSKPTQEAYPGRTLMTSALTIPVHVKAKMAIQGILVDPGVGSDATSALVKNSLFDYIIGGAICFSPLKPADAQSILDGFKMLATKGFANAAAGQLCESEVLLKWAEIGECLKGEGTCLKSLGGASSKVFNTLVKAAFGHLRGVKDLVHSFCTGIAELIFKEDDKSK